MKHLCLASGVILLLISAPVLATDTTSSETMILIPGGSTNVGASNGLPDELPRFTADVPAFHLDRSPVSVADFAAFVSATSHVTTAEEFGDSAVMQFGTGRWFLQPGATWQYPLGPEAPQAPSDHPVTHVSWDDAVAYCDWQDKRLPTEVEWEHAARAGHDGDVQYAFGDRLFKNGEFLANVWTGNFPILNTGEDGYKATSPVGQLGISPIGLTDMAGNVWEWTADWYGSYQGRLSHNDSPVTGTEKVQRGGSFLCDAKVCHGYRVSSRSQSTPDSSMMHVGFRCARDASNSNGAAE